MYDATKPELPPFEPPSGFYAEFEQFSQRIGAAAYHTWFKGAKAWIKRDGEIAIECPTAIRARWIRRHYAETLAELTHRPIIVEGDAGIKPPPPTEDAWWRCHDAKSGKRVREPRNIEAERAEIQARLEAGESVSSMMYPVACVKVGTDGL